MSPFPAEEPIVALVFLLFLGAAISGALLAVFTKWIIRSVCGLALASVGLAGMFYFLGSPFLAMIHILIYIGAVCITIIFAIMLAEPDEPADADGGHTVSWTLGAAGAAGGVFLGLAWIGVSGDWPAPVAQPNSGSVEQIGVALLTTHSLAFITIALVLLVSILGAIAIARKGRHME
jgi:NADH:ubiquinone oxidoreductase subunit 6 (subunit J)